MTTVDQLTPATAPQRGSLVWQWFWTVKSQEMTPDVHQ